MPNGLLGQMLWSAESDINLFTLFATVTVVILGAPHMEISSTPLATQYSVVAISHTFFAFHFVRHFTAVVVQYSFYFGV